MKKSMGGEYILDIRPEDVCTLILDNLHEWNTKELVQKNVSKIKSYLKKERFDKLKSEFGLEK